jgi:hypothetical protein
MLNFDSYLELLLDFIVRAFALAGAIVICYGALYLGYEIAYGVTRKILRF